MVGLWIKYDYLDQIEWIMDVGSVSCLKIGVMWNLPKLVNYEKSHLWWKSFVWFNYISAFMGAFWVLCEKNIEKCARLIMR